MTMVDNSTDLGNKTFKKFIYSSILVIRLSVFTEIKIKTEETSDWIKITSWQRRDKPIYSNYQSFQEQQQGRTESNKI